MNNTTNIEFITTENIEMLWEIITEDGIASFLKKEQSREFFIIEAKNFFETEKDKYSSLILMNKQFISNIMIQFSELKKKQMKQTNQANQINSKNASFTSTIPSEELHSKRMNHFEQSLAEIQADFNNAVTVPIPETPNFYDNVKEEPIGSNMSELIARTLAQRNFELESIHNTNNNTKIDANTWLKPAETSIKTDKALQHENHKMQLEQKQIQYQYKHQELPTLIQIGEEVKAPIIKKQLTWAENLNNDSVEEIKLDIKETNETIFSKLKHIKSEVSIEIDTQIQLQNMNQRINELDEKISTIIKMMHKELE
uniref:Uncharacterized protein n=1 Tax=viral metagenome TaxID=1070528 RepID=A0A6C0B089_9ZZZZ